MGVYHWLMNLISGRKERDEVKRESRRKVMHDISCACLRASVRAMVAGCHVRWWLVQAKEEEKVKDEIPLEGDVQRLPDFAS